MDRYDHHLKFYNYLRFECSRHVCAAYRIQKMVGQKAEDIMISIPTSLALRSAFDDGRDVGERHFGRSRGGGLGPAPRLPLLPQPPGIHFFDLLGKVQKKGVWGRVR